MLTRSTKKCICLFIALLFCVCIAMPATALDVTEQDMPFYHIDNMARTVLSKARIPGAAIVVVQGEDVRYLSYGSDLQTKQSVYEDTLFQIGSVSKAFTALGILLLVDEGKLSLDDPVSKQIPWFTVTIRGNEVAPEDLTIANLLYQTSGFTNNDSLYPQAEPDVTLEEHIKSISNKELSFYPSERYSYANANYKLMGYIIEVVSGQDYAQFMEQRIFTPLGLNATYANPQKALETGLVAQGSRVAFFSARPYPVEVAKGNVPAGFLYSSARDMGRWLQIQMGTVEVSPQFSRIIQKSHAVEQSGRVDASTYYAGGWFVTDTGEIYHPGGTPNYSAKLGIKPNNTAVGVLTNINASANTGGICDNALAIVNGEPIVPYTADVWTVFDLIFSMMTFVCVPLCVLAIIYVATAVSQTKKGLRKRRAYRTGGAILAATLPALLSLAMLVIIPVIFQSTWQGLLVWAPYSIVFGIASFCVASILLLVVTITAQTCPKVLVRDL